MIPQGYRTEYFTFQLTEAEKVMLRALAEKSDVSMTTALRKLIREAARRRRIEVSEGIYVQR